MIRLRITKFSLQLATKHLTCSRKCYSILNNNRWKQKSDDLSLLDINSNACTIHHRNLSVESVTATYTSLFNSISQSKAASITKDGLVTLHDVTGLPWWATILLATAGIRIGITLPLSIYQTFLLAKLELVKIEFGKIVQQLKQETVIAIKTMELTQEEARMAYNSSLKKQWQLIIERENCHPLKSTIVFWFQLPIWVLFSMTLRNMAYRMTGNSIDSQIVALEFSVGGVYWAPNLLLPDVSLILPVSVCLINLIIIELQTVSKKTPPTKLQKGFTYFLRGLALVTLPIAMTVPSCMSFYWVSSSSLALLQNLVLMSPTVKRKMGIPKTPSEPEKPYSEAWSTFKQKWKIS